MTANDKPVPANPDVTTRANLSVWAARHARWAGIVLPVVHKKIG